MEQITLNGKGVVFVVDDHEKFLATITDGDIRRAILSKISLGAKIESLVKKNSKEFQLLLSRFPAEIAKKLQRPSASANIGTPVEELLNMVSERINIIPLLKDHKVVDYFQHKALFYAPIASPCLRGNELKYVVECLETNWISSQGRFIPIFEKMISDYCGLKFGVAVSNGTVALHLALMTLNIAEGDEVIVPDLTFGATINAVLQARATPVIVDVEPDSWCIDPLLIEKAITKKTKAIIPVHIYGQMANMKKISEIAKKNNLFIIEDCAESIGAAFENKMSGGFSDIACYSFFANKVITTGEGGMCLTNSKELDERMKVLRDHGMSKTKRYWHDHVGMNYRLTNIQAAIGVAQVEQIDSFAMRRNQIRSLYEEKLSHNPLFTPQMKIKDRKSITWLVTFLMDKRIDIDKMISLACEINIDLRPFFYPLSEMEPFKKFKFETCPVTNDLSSRGLCFPTSMVFSDEEYCRIIRSLDEISHKCIKFL